MGLNPFAKKEEAEAEPESEAAVGAPAPAAAEPEFEQSPPSAGEYSLRIQIAEARDLLPVDESDTPDPILKVNLTGLPCPDQKWEDNRKKKQKDTANAFFNATVVFEFTLTQAEQLKMGSLAVEVWDQNTFSSDDKLGSFLLDLSQLWNYRQHEIWRRWVGLLDVSGTFEGPRGYLKLSCTLVGPGESMPFHDPASQAAEDAVADQQEPMMPPTLAMVPYELVVELYKAEDLPEMDVGGDSGGKCDAYGKVEFAGMSEESQVIVSQSPDWTTHPSHPGVPEMVRLKFAMPEGGKLSSDVIKFAVWDKDWPDGDDVVGAAFISMAEIRKNPRKWERPFWINFYGAPASLSAGQLVGSTFGKLLGPKQEAGKAGTTATDIQKLMNEGKMPGQEVLYRGRVLVAVGVHPKGDAPLYSFKSPPAETEWLLCVELYEACDLPFDREPRVVLSVGPNEVATTHRIESPDGGPCRRAQWYQTAYMKLSYPDDKTQLPEIFINLYKGDERTSYKRFSPKSISRFAEMRPEWEHLQRDPFGPLGLQDYPGTLFMSMGLGRKAEWDELVKEQPHRDSGRKEKELLEAKQRKKDMLLGEERLQVARCIATKSARNQKELIERVGLFQTPSKAEKSSGRRTGNDFWLDNIEMVIDQSTLDTDLGRKILSTMDIALAMKKEGAVKQGAGSSPDPAEPNWVVSANADPQQVEWTRLDELMRRVRVMTGASGADAVAPPPATSREDFIFVYDYEQVWNDDGSRAREDGSIWRPKCSRDGYAVFGDVAADDRAKPLGATLAVRKDRTELAKACTDFNLVWQAKRGGDERRAMKPLLYLWEPVAPSGYQALGIVATTGTEAKKPDAKTIMCIKEDPGLVEPVEELEMVWNTDGCNFDNPIGLWRVVGCNTFHVKKEAPRCKPDDYLNEPSTAYRRVKLSVLPARPSLTKKSSMSKVGLLQCKRFGSSGGGLLAGLTKTWSGGNWERGYYTLNYEALTEFGSEGDFDKYKLPKNALFLKSDMADKVDRITKIQDVRESGFEIEVKNWENQKHTWSFRAPCPNTAAEWHRVIKAHWEAWTPGAESAASSTTHDDIMSAQELSAAIEAQQIEFKVTTVYRQVWNSEGSSARSQLSIWRPYDKDEDNLTDTYWFGDCAAEGPQEPSRGILVAYKQITPGVDDDEDDEDDDDDEDGKSEQSKLRTFAKPTSFKLVAHKMLKREPWEGVWFWQPVYDKGGFHSLGLVVTTDEREPKPEAEDPRSPIRGLRCINEVYLDQTSNGMTLNSLWDDRSTNGVMMNTSQSLQIWAAPTGIGTFYATESRRQPHSDAIFTVKPFLTPEVTELSHVFVEMAEYRQKFLLMDKIPKMSSVLDIEADLNHAIQRAKMEVERIQFIPSDAASPMYAPARAYFSPITQLTPDQRDMEWKNLLKEVKASQIHVKEKEGLIFNCDYELRVFIYQGRGLPSADPDGLADPFIKASCAGEWAKRALPGDPTDPGSDKLDQTAIKQRTVNPIWNEVLSFKKVGCLKGLPRWTQMPGAAGPRCSGACEICDKEGRRDPKGSQGQRDCPHVVWPKLTLHLLDWDDQSKDEFLGRVSISLADIAANMYRPTTPRWEAVKRGDTDIDAGQVLVSCQLFPMEIESRTSLSKLSRMRLREHCERAAIPLKRASSISDAQWKEQMINGLMKCVVNNEILRPKMMECTIEVLLLGCRDLKGSGGGEPDNPCVEFDLGDPTNNLGKSKPSAKPSGDNPNYGEVIKLKARIPQDPLFAPTISVRVKEHKGGETIGTCSIDLQAYLPRWDAVAAAFITRLRKGQLARRKFREAKALRKFQSMWRAHRTQKKLKEALRIQYTKHGLTGKLNSSPLLNPKKRGSRAIKGMASARSTRSLCLPSSPVSSGSSDRQSQSQTMSDDSNPATGDPYIGWKTRLSNVKTMKMVKVFTDGKGKREQKPFFSTVRTYHQVSLQPTQKNPGGDPRPVKVAQPLSLKGDVDMSTDEGKFLCWGEEAPADPWRWCSGRADSCRMEYRDELEHVEIASKRLFPAFFQRFVLYQGSEVSDGGGGLMAKFKGSGKQEVGVLKAIVRIVDNSPAVVTEYPGACRDQRADMFMLRSWLREHEPTVRFTQWDGSIVHAANCLCPACGDERLDRLYASHSLFKNFRCGDALLDSGAKSGGSTGVQATDLSANKGDTIVEVLNIKNWRFGFNESVLLELAQLGSAGHGIAESLLPLVEAHVLHDEALLPPEPEPEEEPYNSTAVDRPPEPPGILEVKVISASNLRDMEMFGKMSPYIKITLADSPKSALLRGQQKSGSAGAADEDGANESDEKVKKTRTHWKAGGASVDFGGEVLKIPVEKDDRCVLIEAWDHEKDPLFAFFGGEGKKADDFIGHAAFPLEDFLHGFKGHWPDQVSLDDDNPGGRIKLYSDTKRQRYAGEVELKLVFKESPLSDSDAPRVPLSAPETRESLRLAGIAARQRWEEIKDMEQSLLIAPREVNDRAQIWGQFQMSQVQLRSIPERLDPEDMDGNWAHLWPSEPDQQRNRHKLPSLKWQFPAGAWIMCGSYTVTFSSSNAAAASKDHSDPKGWALMAGHAGDGPDDFEHPGKVGWDLLSRISPSEFWRSALGKSVKELLPGKNGSKKAKVKAAKAATGGVDAAARSCKFTVCAPTVNELKFAKMDRDSLRTSDLMFPVTTQWKEKNNGLARAKAKKEELKQAWTKQDQQKEDRKWLEALQRKTVEHIVHLVEKRKANAGKGRQAGKKYRPKDLQEFLRHDKESKTKGIRESDMTTALQTILLVGSTAGGENKGASGACYTSALCREELAGRSLADYLDDRMVEAKKHCGSGLPDQINASLVRHYVKTLLILLGRMPGLWFQLIAFMWQSSSSPNLRAQMQRVFDQQFVKGAAAAVARRKDPASATLAEQLAEVLQDFCGFTPDAQSSGTGIRRRTLAYEFRVFHIETVEYSLVRRGLREKFSGELLRKVERDYFADEVRSAQGVLVDLAEQVSESVLLGRTRGENKIKDTFMMAKRLSPRFNLPPSPGPARDEALREMEAADLTKSELRHVLSMMQFIMSEQTFEEVMHMLDRDPDGWISYDEFVTNIKQTMYDVEAKMGMISYCEVGEMLQALTRRLRGSEYRFFKLTLTDMVDADKSFVQLGGLQLHKSARPWGPAGAAALPDDDAAAQQQGEEPAEDDALDPTLQLLQPQDVLVRAYTIDARGLMPKDDDGAADPYVVTTLDGAERGSETDKRHSLEPQFRVAHEFQAKLPGPSQLTLAVWDDDLIGRDLMGQTTIDLEDRWFCRQWRASGPHGAKPIESRALMLGGKAAEQGRLRMWLDIIPMQVQGVAIKAPPLVDIAKAPGIPFELRVVIWKAEDLPAMDTLEGTNDAFVTGELVGVNDDDQQSAYYVKKETDTHWRSKTPSAASSIFSCPPTCRCLLQACKKLCECLKFCCCCCCAGDAKKEQPSKTTPASWNYRFIYDVELPMKDCRFYLQAWDKDVLNTNGEAGDLIGGHIDTENGHDVEAKEEHGQKVNLGFDTIMDMFAEAEGKYRRWALRVSKLEQIKKTRKLTEEEEADLRNMDDLQLHRPDDRRSRAKMQDATNRAAGSGASKEQDNEAVLATRALGEIPLSRKTVSGKTLPGGKLYVEYFLVHKRLASTLRAGEGRAEPNSNPTLPEPDRVSLLGSLNPAAMLLMPCMILKSLLGPNFFRQVCFLAVCLACLAFLLLLAPQIIGDVVVTVGIDSWMPGGD